MSATGKKRDADLRASVLAGNPVGVKLLELRRMSPEEAEAFLRCGERLRDGIAPDETRWLMFSELGRPDPGRGVTLAGAVHDWQRRPQRPPFAVAAGEQAINGTEQVQAEGCKIDVIDSHYQYDLLD